MKTCKNCKLVNVRESNGIAVSKWCAGCRKAKTQEKKDKHKLTKTYEKSRYKTLHKKAWKVFSEWIRSKDAVNGNVECYSCRVIGNYKTMQAGHYFHSKLDFDERNVHVQCCGCNLYKHGNLAPYGVRLALEIGAFGMEQLRLDSNTVKYTIEGLERIIEEYTPKIKIW